MRKFKLPKLDGFTIMILIVFLVGGLTHIVPASHYERIIEGGREKVVPGTHQFTESQGLSLYEIVKSIPEGITAAAALVVMILIIGGAVKVFEDTGAIKGGIATIIRSIGVHNSKYILVAVFLFFAALGAFPGMLEASIPFAPLCVSVALLLGYDVIVGMAIPLVGIVIGWTAGPTNPWTVGIAHDLAGLPIFSGIGFRLVLLAVTSLVSLFYILRYAEKVKANPSRGLKTKFNKKSSNEPLDSMAFGWKEITVLIIFALTILAVVIGGINYGAGLMDMAAIYIIGAVIAGFVAGFDIQKIVDALLKGGKSIFIGAIAVGVARSISLIMEKGAIMDTIIYFASEELKGYSTMVSGTLLLFAQCIMNLAIPSGSGQAMATLPVVLPIADLIGLSKQVAILAFQFGDGFSNLAYPTVGTLIAFLAYTKITYLQWLKFIWPLAVLLYGIAILTILIAIQIHY